MFNYIYTPKSGSKVVSGWNGEKGPFCLTLTNGSHFLVGGVMLPIRRANGHRASRSLAVRIAQIALRDHAGHILDENGNVAVYVLPSDVPAVIKSMRNTWLIAIRARLDVDGIDIDDADLAAELAEASTLVSLQYDSIGDRAEPESWMLMARYEDFSSATQSVPSALIGNLLGVIDDLDRKGFKAGPVPSGLYPEDDNEDNGEVVIRPSGMGEIQDEEV